MYIPIVSKVILVGTISNADKQLEQDFARVYKSLHFFEEVDVFLVESDSSDATIDVLNRIGKKIPNFNYVSLGNLKSVIPNRIERIRKCRNMYVEYIRNRIDLKKWDYVVVADLDGMNSALKSDSILRVFSSQTSWDACFPNQKFGYYDLYALREESWMPRDCFQELNSRKSEIPKRELGHFHLLNKLRNILDYDRARKLVLYNKMHVISKRAKWIEVNSAFGGLAIYKSKWFIDFDYSKFSESNVLVSEHVDFNLKCTNAKAKFYIVPKFIISNWNEYNINKIFMVRQLRSMRYYFLGKQKKLN